MTPNFDQLVESILEEAKRKKKKAKKKNKSSKPLAWRPWGYWGGYNASLHDIGSEGGGDGE